MNNITNKQLIIVCTATGILVSGSIAGIVTFEKRRKEYLARIKDEKSLCPAAPSYEQRVATFAKKDRFGSISTDPEIVVISERVTDQVDIILPESIDKLEGRYAQTKSHRFFIYADTSVVRPGLFAPVFVDYYDADHEFLYNGWTASPADLSGLLGKDFTEEILPLGIGRELQLVVYSTVPIDKQFLRIILTFHKEGAPLTEQFDTIEDDDTEAYDPDDPQFSEPDENPPDETDEEFDENAIQEMIDAEEIDQEERFFDPDASITLDATGELDEADNVEGWTVVEWRYRVSTTCLLHDENDEVISQEDAIEWLTLPILAIIDSPTVIQNYPGRMIYVRNGKLKIMFEITID